MTAPPHGLYGTPIAMPWQTILADLALILFMMTAAALANAPDAPLLPNAVPPPAPSAQGEPVGVWREGPGMPRLAEWLAQQARDPRLRVSILMRHRAGQEHAALTHAQALVAEAGAHAASARIVVEPGREDAASVVLAYDAQ